MLTLDTPDAMTLTEACARKIDYYWPHDWCRIEALEEPRSGGGTVDAWVAANRRQAALTQELATAFAAQDQTRIARLSERIDALEERNNATARRLGMRACAERVQG